MKDLIDRQAAINTILSLTNCSTVRELYEYIQEHQLTNYWTDGINDAIDAVIGVPPAQPEIIRCKDCKHWRDSDGVYRRGIDAESKCPLNTQEVYAGTFYCGFAERRDE